MKITIIYDNTAFKKELQADWGFSCLVKVNKCGYQGGFRQILFDTGAKGEILLSNMRKLKIEKEIEPKEGKLILISVYDNYQFNPELKTAWGFGCLIKTEKENILFDTGGNSETLIFNLKKLGINPKSIDKVVFPIFMETI